MNANTNVCEMCYRETYIMNNKLCQACCELLGCAIPPKVTHHGMCDTHIPFLIGNTSIKESILKNRQILIDCEKCRDCKLVKSVLNLDVKECLEVPKVEPLLQTTKENPHCNGNERCLSCQDSTKPKETKAKETKSQKQKVYRVPGSEIKVFILD